MYWTSATATRGEPASILLAFRTGEPALLDMERALPPDHNPQALTILHYLIANFGRAPLMRPATVFSGLGLHPLPLIRANLANLPALFRAGPGMNITDSGDSSASTWN